MDFEKVLSQRQAKATATKAPEPEAAAPASKPGPKPRATSKRNDPDWVAATLFLKQDTKRQLERFLAAVKLTDRITREKADLPLDQSDAVEEALQLWLKREIPKLQKRLPHISDLEGMINGG